MDIALSSCYGGSQSIFGKNFTGSRITIWKYTLHELIGLQFLSTPLSQLDLICYGDFRPAWKL